MARFYVYELIDPRDGRVFYVGKGQRQRIDAHEAEAKNGRQSRKCGQIRAIWDAGLIIEKRRIFQSDDEGAAYAFEAERIAAIGLADLTNVVAGGGGVSRERHWTWTPELVRRHKALIWRALRALAAGRPITAIGLDWRAPIRAWLRRLCDDLGREAVAKILGASQ